MIDGEAVLLGDDGISDFNGLHSRKHDDEVKFYAFDFLVSDGEDVRKLPLSMRKTSLARLLARVDGIFLSDFEQGEIGPDLFRHACLMGLEGLVSKHRDSHTAPADRRIGSRSRTGSIRLSAGCRISSKGSSAALYGSLDVRRSERWANGSGCMSSRTSMMLEEEIKLHRFAGISPEQLFYRGWPPPRGGGGRRLEYGRPMLWR